MSNVIVFNVVLYDNLYVFLLFPSFPFDVIVFAFSVEFISPVGNWSIIWLAYPALFPSLYIVILYVTVSFSFISTGSFLWLYVAVVPVFSVFVNTFGSLLFASCCPFTSTMYFLNAKSNSSVFATNFVVIVSGVFSTSTSGCSPTNVIEFAVSVPCNHNVFFVLWLVISKLKFISWLLPLSTLM